MAGLFGGNGGTVFGNSGGSVGFGGFLDDLFGETEDVAGETTGATAAGTPKTVDATVIDGMADPKAKHSQGALPKFGPTCPSDMINDPLNPQNFCIPNPKVNFTCPAGQIYDYARKPTPGCAPYAPDLIQGAVPQTGVICPYGTKAVGNACVSLVGASVVKPLQTTPGPATGGGGTTNPNINALGGSGVPTWAIALAGVGVVGIVGAAIYAKSKDKKKGRR